MGKIAFLFPGQGIKKDDLFQIKRISQEFSLIQNILENVQKILKEETLFSFKTSRPRQIEIFIFSIAIDNLLKSQGIYPDYVAGHSLGQYSALVSAEALSFEEGLRLVYQREKIMENVCLNTDGAMMAIVGLDIKEIGDILKEIPYNKIKIANHNSYSQVVVSGEKEGIEITKELAIKKGATRCITLNVNGAFHTFLMKPAQEEFALVLKNTNFKNSKIPIVANTTGKILYTQGQIKQELEKHMISKVEWVKSMENLLKEKVSLFIEVGPGKILKGLMKNINSQLSVFTTSSCEDIRFLLSKLQNARRNSSP